MCGQPTAYNTYATLPYTNPLFMGFSCSQNVNKEIIFQERRYQEKPILQGLQKLWNAVRCAGIYIECNKDIDMYRTFFGRNTGECPFLRVSTSGATDSEYVEMMLASIETYLLDGIARQRDMSKIALQSANGTDCFLNLINRIYKLLYIKVGIHFLGECHCT